MNPTFITMTLFSTLHLPFDEQGHIFYRPTPCTVIAKYSERTGTVVIDTVVCQGRHYDFLEIESADWDKFHTQLKNKIAEQEF